VRWLWRFSTRSQREEVNRLIAKAKFYRELNYKLTLEIEKAKLEMAKMDPAPQPTIIEDPIDPELQTGESQLLGGGLQIKAPWLGKP